MNCKYCKGNCIKKGKYKSVQKYHCRECGKYQRSQYRQQSYNGSSQHDVSLLHNEGLGIRSISRVLKIPRSSIQMLLLREARRIIHPIYKEQKQSYEVDELYAYVGSKKSPCYIIYAINRRTKEVIDFVVSSRTKENIKKIVGSLLKLSPRKIYTDGLPVYGSLIPSQLHGQTNFGTNRIERKNLTIRTHLKRLSRKTICYSKSEKMLENSFRLYVWSFGCC